MTQVSIRPVWTIQDPEGTALPARLIELLVRVAETGSLLHAAKALGMSYRRAWDLVRLGEQHFQTPLLVMERGKGFKQRVKLEVKAPVGVQVEPKEAMVEPGDKGDVQLKITVAKDAPIGEHKILVKGTPDKGEPAATEFKITVSAK